MRKHWPFCMWQWRNRILWDASDIEYSQAVTDAWENAIPALNAGMDARLDELKEAGATDADVQFFRDTLSPRLREQMETEICNEPKAWLGPEGKEKAAKFFAETLDAVKRDLALMRLAPSKPEDFENNLRFVLEIDGFTEFMDDATTKAAVLKNVKTWLKGDSVQQLMEDLRRAQMTNRVYGNDSGTRAAKDAKGVFERFHAGIRAAVVGIQAAILQGEFRNTQLEPALKLFEMWLEQYDLPKSTIWRGTEETTLKQKLMEHFTQRVHDLQRRMTNEGRVSEPLLSQEYLESFLRYVNEIGTSVMLAEMEETVKAEQMERLTDREKELFGLDGIHDAGRSKAEREAVLVNNMGLRKLMDLNLTRIETELRSNPLGIEELQRWKDQIKSRFGKRMANVNSFRISCEFRVMLVRQLPEVERKDLAFLQEALKARFGGVDIASSATVAADPKLAGAVPDLVATLGNAMSQRTVEKSEALRKKALEPVDNPLSFQETFLHDEDNNPALTDSFKELARSLVQGAAGTKPFKKLFKQLDKKLGASVK